MTLFTGLYPEAHRVKNPFAGKQRWVRSLSETIPTFAEILVRSGYRNEARVGGGNVDGAIGFARGFESYEQPGSAQAIFRSAAGRLKIFAAARQPFFLFVHTFEVHSPYLATEPYRDLFVDPDYEGRIVGDPATLLRATGVRGPSGVHREFWGRVNRLSATDVRHLVDLYDASIRYTDEQLGALLDALETTGLADRTIVVVLSDHGEEFAEHGGFEHEALWQELLHVPLVFRVPEGVRAGWSHRRVADVVGLVDVMPTLLELMSVPVPGHLQGRSLVSLVEQGTPGRSWLFSQHRALGEVALRAADWKVLRSREREYLFDLARDPRELRDDAGAHPGVRGAIVDQIDSVLQASRAYRGLATGGAHLQPDAEMREQLEALGYVDEEEGSGEERRPTRPAISP